MRADLKDYDAPSPLSYPSLIETALSSLAQPLSLDGFVSKVGSRALSDVSEVEVLQPVIWAGPELPPGFSERFFQFRDEQLGRGLLDVAFHHSTLVNFRAQLFLGGWFGRSRARRYFATALVPLYQRLLGPAIQREADVAYFKGRSVVGVARYIRGTEAVSAHLTHEKFAGSAPGPSGVKIWRAVLPAEELALSVNDLLTRFVAIQREMANLPWWRHLPVPGLFRAIDFSEHERSLVALLSEMGDVRNRISQLRDSGTISTREAEFLDALHAYASALQQAVEALREISRKLHLRSQGSASYDWASYKEDHTELAALERNYISLGGHLNVLFAALKQ